MTRVIEMKEGKSFEYPEVGTYSGAVVGVYDLGTQPESKAGTNGQKFSKPAMPMVMVNFELVDSPQSDGSPTTLVKEYPLKHSSYLQGSGLFNLHKTILGLSTADLERNDDARALDAILGKHATVTVGLTTGDKPKVENVSRVMKGAKLSKPQSELLLFDTDNPDPEVFSKLPGFVQRKIINSLENPLVGPDDSNESTALDL